MSTNKNTRPATLVARYNVAARALGRKPVKRFADRKTAERRVRAIEAELKPAALRAADPDYANRVGEARGFNFELPGRPAKERKEPRENTRRAKLLDELQRAGKKGTSFAALDKACGFKNRKSTRDGLGLLARANGYGVVAEGDTVRLK